MDVRGPGLLDVGHREGERVVVGRARLPHRHREGAQLVDLGRRRGLGHEQRGRRPAPQGLGRERHAKGMVAGGSGHHTPPLLFGPEAGEHARRTAHLEGTGGLPALELQVRLARGAQGERAPQRRRRQVGGDRPPRPLDVIQGKARRHERAGTAATRSSRGSPH